jgi:hypothetical protein
VTATPFQPRNPSRVSLGNVGLEAFISALATTWFQWSASRPAVAANLKRTAVFRFVTTKAEAAKIRSKAKEQGLTLSEYLRQVAIPRS